MGLPDVPTLSVVGTGASQLALLDTTGARALIVLGLPQQDVLDQVPAMLTTFRQRIDLLIGDEAAIDVVAGHARDRWNTAHELVIPTALGGRAALERSRRTVVRSGLTIELGDGCTTTLTIAPQGEWENTDADDDMPPR
jgi:hypothetical protein